jgi:hypothetical protein
MSSSSSSPPLVTPQRDGTPGVSSRRVSISDKVLLYLNSRQPVRVDNPDIYDERLKHTLEAINRRGTTLAVNRPSIAALQLYLLQDPTVYGQESADDDDVAQAFPVIGPIDTPAKAYKLTRDLYLASAKLEEEYYYQHNATHPLLQHYPKFYRVFEEAVLLRTRLAGLIKGRALTFYKLLALYSWIVDQPSAPDDLRSQLRDIERELSRRQNDIESELAGHQKELPSIIDRHKAAVRKALLLVDLLLTTGLASLKDRTPKQPAPKPLPGSPVVVIKLEPQSEPQPEPEEPQPQSEQPEPNDVDVNDDEEQPPPPPPEENLPLGGEQERPVTPFFDANEADDVNNEEGDQYED